jgi:hypothetical protein
MNSPEFSGCITRRSTGSPINPAPGELFVMMNKIDKIKKIADIKIEKRGKKWLVN